MTRTPYNLIENESSLERAISEFGKAPILGVDTETTGLDPFRCRVRLIQIATQAGAFVIDLFKIPALKHETLRGLLHAPRPIKVFHNAKFDVKMLLHHFGIEVRGIFDTRLASQLTWQANEGGHSLAQVSERLLGELVDKTLQKSDWSGELTESQYEYAAKDAVLMLPLREKLVRRISELSLVEVAKLEFDCVLPTAAMELAGVAIDRECWQHLVAGVERAHKVLTAELKRELAAGIPQLTLFGDPEINLDSPSQVVETLGRMGIKVEGTRSGQLQPLAQEHPAIAKLLEYRIVQKSLTSFGLPLLEHISPATGRIHADFHQIGAMGGRMACSEPNLQQIPNTPDYRGCFRAPSGRKLVVADYSQIELRILADWSQDTALVKALVSGEDLHCVTASRMFGVPLEQVSKEQRAAAKQLNYGIMYGLGAPSLAARIDTSVDEAEDLIRKYFAVYKEVAVWLRDAADRAVREKQSRTRSGRLITFSYDPSDRSQVAATQRVGKNAPIQGSSADITKRALALLYEALRPLDAQIVNCIHDEIVVEVAAGKADECAVIVEREMIAAARQFIRSVPVTVDTVIGDAWLK